MSEGAVKALMIIISALLFLAPFGYGYLEHQGSVAEILSIKLPSINITPPNPSFKEFKDITLNTSSGEVMAHLILEVENKLNTSITVNDVSFNITCIDSSHPHLEVLIAKGYLPKPVEIPANTKRELTIIIKTTPEGAAHILKYHLKIGVDPSTGEPVYIIYFTASIKDGILNTTVYGVNLVIPLTVKEFPVYLTYPVGG